MNSEKSEWTTKLGILGESHQVIEGDEYAGIFRGQGFVTGDQEASFLSDELERRMTTLEMTDLFPKDWGDSKVRYVITVKARRIAENPKQP